MPAWQLEGWFRNYGSDTQAGKIERDQRDNLDDVMRRSAKGAIVIGLPGWMAVGDLDDPTHQDQRNAHNSQQR